VGASSEEGEKMVGASSEEEKIVEENSLEVELIGAAIVIMEEATGANSEASVASSKVAVDYSWEGSLMVEDSSEAASMA